MSYILLGTTAGIFFVHTILTISTLYNIYMSYDIVSWLMLDISLTLYKDLEILRHPALYKPQPLFANIHYKNISSKMRTN